MWGDDLSSKVSILMSFFRMAIRTAQLPLRVFSWIAAGWECRKSRTNWMSPASTRSINRLVPLRESFWMLEKISKGVCLHLVTILVDREDKQTAKRLCLFQEMDEWLASFSCQINSTSCYRVSLTALSFVVERSFNQLGGLSVGRSVIEIVNNITALNEYLIRV